MFNSKLKKEIKELKEQIRLYKLDCKMASSVILGYPLPKDLELREQIVAITKLLKHDARKGTEPFGMKNYRLKNKG